MGSQGPSSPPSPVASVDEILDLAQANNVKGLAEIVPRSRIWEVRDTKGSTVLHFAAGSGALEVCRWLLSSEVLLNEQDTLCTSTHNQRTALHWAARNGHAEICRLLIQGDSQVDSSASFAKTIPVDILAKGQVTPLQLAIWQAHLPTCRLLVELGADPHYVNSWGCALPHWVAKCPLFPLVVATQCDGDCWETPSSTGASSSVSEKQSNMRHRIQKTCHWLFQECGVTCWNLANHHGQTPLHKAAYAGNLPMLEYLLQEYDILDDQRDHQGNTAADCAERAQLFSVARWIRRHMSPFRKQALQTLGCYDTNNKPKNTGIRDGTEEKYMNWAMPSVEHLRASYLRRAREAHPDAARRGRKSLTAIMLEDSCTSTSWDNLQDSYHLLINWWEAPESYDLRIRLLSRNRALQEFPMLTWLPEWHNNKLIQGKQQSEARQHPRTLTNPRKPAVGEQTTPPEILLFEQRLVSLLLTDAHREKGISLSSLPKEYSKNFGNMINHKAYKCKKIIYLLQRHCPNVFVKTNTTNDQQPRVFANVAKKALAMEQRKRYYGLATHYST